MALRLAVGVMLTFEVRVLSGVLYTGRRSWRRSWYLSVTAGRSTWWVMRWDVARAPAGRFRSADGLMGWTWGRRRGVGAVTGFGEVDRALTRRQRRDLRVWGMANPGEDCGGCGGDVGPSLTYPWHWPDEDCRAIRAPVEDRGVQR